MDDLWQLPQNEYADYVGYAGYAGYGHDSDDDSGGGGYDSDGGEGGMTGYGGGYGGDDPYLDAYDDDDGDLAQSDDEGKEWDYGGDDGDDDDEFDQFVDKDPDEYGFSYTQLTHVSFGDDLGTTIGGKYSKIEKIMHMQTESKEKLYTIKFKAELNTLLDSFGKTNHYATLIQSVPRFWLKNVKAMAGTIFMIDKLKGVKLTANKLANYSAQTGLRKEDLFRYYRLLEKYIT